MNDLANVLFSHSPGDKLTDSLSKVSRQLPKELRRQLIAVFEQFVTQYGSEEAAIAHMNNRSMLEIFAECRTPHYTETASGEVNGVKYYLSEPRAEVPKDPGNDSSR